MITILIRTSNRPKKFKRCIDSVINQTYQDFKVIVCIDGDDYVGNHEKISKFKAPKHDRIDYYWNLFCNDLKEKVSEGHLFFLDDDDILIDNEVLFRLSQLLEENKSYICRMKRKYDIFPTKNRFKNKTIIRGNIGMPCIILHHTHKSICDFDNQKASDYRFITNLSEAISLEWINFILVDVQGEGRRRKEYQ